MKINWTILLSSFILCILSPTYGRLHFRKLSASEVYNALRDAGHLNAIPEGRMVTNGIAAATGFLAGISKGITIPMLGRLPWFNTNRNSNPVKTVWQEICFSSRNANEIDESEETKTNKNALGRSNDSPQGRQGTSTTATGSPTGTTSPTQTSATTPSTTTTGVGTMLPTTTTATTSPTTTATATATTSTNGSGSGTDTETTTQTGTGGSVNCIVVPKRAAG